MRVTDDWALDREWSRDNDRLGGGLHQLVEAQFQAVHDMLLFGTGAVFIPNEGFARVAARHEIPRP